MIARALYGLAHTPGYKLAFNVLAFVGVFVHEVAHYTVGTIVRAKPGKMSVKYRSEDRTRVSPHGSVKIPEKKRYSVLQIVAMSLAPLFVSTFLFMFCLDVIFHMHNELWVKAVAFAFCVSLVVGSKPSGADIRAIGDVYHLDPRYSVYQIFLLMLSGALIWLFVDIYFFILPFEVMYYIGYFIVLTTFYFGIKGIFWTVGRVGRGIVKKLGKAQISSPKFLTRRRRFKHTENPNEREVQWH